ncbi:6-phosphogluconolactonase [Candidatus Micrarchaeota archaeon]|nr:6-phosphogluconolactonase [Candidatus Micrarchaeota archaeon]
MSEEPQKYKIFANSNLVAEFVGKKWKEYQKKFTRNGLFFVSCPLSMTSLPLYKWVIQNAKSFEDWNKFRFVLMDEQIEGNSDYSYVLTLDPVSYEKFARDNFLSHLKKYLNSQDQILLKPALNNFKEFDGLIETHGGLDLLILTIGPKGHYAQVMPGTKADIGFHISKLLPEFMDYHKSSGSYKDTKIRNYGMSIGPKQVLSAKKIILIITGSRKKQLLRDYLYSYSSFNPDFPLSIIHHPKIKGKVEVAISRDVL